MSSPSHRSGATALGSIEPNFANDQFWLAKLDETVQRAQVLPDHKWSAPTTRTYLELPFSFSEEVTRGLGKLTRTYAVPHLVLCGSLMAVLFAKYHRHDAFIIGIQTAGDISTIAPLSVKCGRQSTLLTVMEAISTEIVDIVARSPFNSARMAEILRVENRGERCPFFDVAFGLRDTTSAFDLSEFPVDILFFFDVTCGFTGGNVRYVSDLFETSTIQTLLSHFSNATSQVCLNPTLRVDEIDLLGTDERRRLLHEFSGRAATFPLNRTLHDLFGEQVRRTPQSVAAIYGDTRLSYLELNARANRLAHTLVSVGLEKGQFVGILLKRSCDFVTAILGTLKAGGAYVPLDPSYPRDRIQYMLDDSQAAFIISDAATIMSFDDVLHMAPRLHVVLSLEGSFEAKTPICLSSINIVEPQDIASAPEHDPVRSVAATDRAYMIYTSGSTGHPKGAICRHNGALNHLYGELEGLGVDSAFKFLQTAASSSDISVWQFLAPLLFGGTTVIVDYEVVVDPARLCAAIRDEHINLVELVPVVFRSLIDYVNDLPVENARFPQLRFMMSTGEALSSELVDRWFSLYPEIPLANTYGPTEASDDVTLLVLRAPISDGQAAVVPIGRPLPNLFLFILDPHLRLAPQGVPGEIGVAGIGVGEGYWRQPEKTAAAFVPSPFPEVSGGSMYRTGDLGRWLPDGTIEFLGRIDQQVKVRGFRVEVGEVEAVLRKYPFIRDAAVVAVEDRTGTNRLVAYFVADEGRPVDVTELRQFLRGSLTDQMIPAAMVRLKALPVTPLGKVDRKALSKMENVAEVIATHVAPRDEIEEAIAGAWTLMLGQSRIGIHDNYFEIGGDSILIIYICAELKRVGLQITPRQFFLYPTIAQLAAEVRSASAQLEGKAANGTVAYKEPSHWNVEGLRQLLEQEFPDLDEFYPLSATQLGMYVQALILPRNSGAYIEQVGFDLTGNLDEDAFIQAWRDTVANTDVLRSAVVRQRNSRTPVQVVLPSVTLNAKIHDWRDRSDVEQNLALADLETEDRQKGFKLRVAPLMRLTLIRLSQERWHVLWTYHHLILDGWSEPLVLGSVFTAYNSLMEGGTLKLTPFPSYRDFIAWSESQDLDGPETFWRRQLSGFVSPVSFKNSWPVLHPVGAGLSHGWHERVLADELATRLHNFTRFEHLTLSTIIHGAWGLLLHRESSCNDVVFGSVTSGRQCNFAAVESVRGVVVVTQPLRTHLAPKVTISEWLRLLQLQMAEVREFEQTSLDLIQSWCDVPREKRPLFDTIVVMANYVGSDLANCQLNGVEISNVSYITQPLYALTLFVVFSAAKTAVRLVYDKRRYAPQMGQDLLDQYCDLLTSIVDNPARHVL